MSRATAVVDRVATALAALLLIGAGLALVAWPLRLLPRLDGPLAVGPAADATGASWWPWAAAGAAVVLLALGLRWLLAHVPNRAHTRRPLQGSDPQGRLVLDLASLAGTAADALAGRPGVGSARGRVLGGRDDGTVELVATIEPLTSLALVADAVRHVDAEVAEATQGRVPVRYRVRVARRTNRNGG